MFAAGIDPGLKGGIVILSDPMQLYVPPLIGGKMDWREYAFLFDKLKDCIVVIEEVHSLYKSSAKSNFTFGGMFYSAVCLLHAKGVTFELVPPKIWQKEIWSHTDRVYVNRGKSKQIDAKKTSLLASRRLAPGEHFLFGENEAKMRPRTRARDGLVDAFLIAEYCRRKLL